MTFLTCSPNSRVDYRPTRHPPPINTLIQCIHVKTERIGRIFSLGFI